MKWMKKLRRAHAVQLVRVGFPGRLGAHGGARVAFVATTLLLDETGLGSAAAAYSVRKLRAAYSGSAIRVRRSSDSTEQDIGFSGNDLDESALTTFCGAGNGFVVTWYDQSGNGRNFTQATASAQPKIVASGTVNKVNGKPAVLGTENVTFLGFTITATEDALFASGEHIAFVGQWTDTPSLNDGAFCFFSDGTPGYLKQFIMRASDLEWVDYDGTAGNSARYPNVAVDTNQTLFECISSGTGSPLVVAKNTTETASTENLGAEVKPGTSNNWFLFSGTLDATRAADINIQEFVVWDGGELAAKATMRTNINTYFSVYA